MFTGTPDAQDRREVMADEAGGGRRTEQAEPTTDRSRRRTTRPILMVRPLSLWSSSLAIIPTNAEIVP